MLAFGLGTMPLMLGFGTASSFIPKDWKHRLTMVLAVVVMVFGLVFINRAAMLVGSPVTFNSVKSGGRRRSPSATDSAGRRSTRPAPTASSRCRSPSSTRGTCPRRSTSPPTSPCGCCSTGRKTPRAPTGSCITQLGIDVALAPNAVTTIDIPATAAGTYSMTCGMGMMSGHARRWRRGGVVRRIRRFAGAVALAHARSHGRCALRGTRREQQVAPRSRQSQPTPDSRLHDVQLVLIVGGIAAALIVGLALGGFFS